MTDLLVATGVRKEFGGLIAVNDVDFLIPERRHKIEMAEGVHDTPLYDVTHEGALTDRDPSDD